MGKIHENGAEAMQLEGAIDTHGLHAVLQLVADICRAKEAHVQDNWQDKGLAKMWAKNAKIVERASDGVEDL